MDGSLYRVRFPIRPIRREPKKKVDLITNSERWKILMIKRRAYMEKTNIGGLELGNLIFDEDYMEISINICDMSDDLKKKVEKVIEIGKRKYSERMKF